MVASGAKRVGLSLAAWALVISACASAPRLAPVEVGRVRASDLLGMTSDQIIASLGGAPGGAHYVSSARLDGAARVTEGPFMFLTRTACSEDAVGRRFASTHQEYAGDNGGNIDTTFSDGRLTQLSDPRSGPLAPDAMIVLTCSGGPRSDPGQDFAFGALAIAGAPAFIAIGASRRAEVNARLEVLSSLKLGAPPPGGLDAFLAAHADIVTLERREAQDADFQIMIDEHQNHLPYAHVHVREGRVAELRGPLSPRCQLADDGSLDCAED